MDLEKFQAELLDNDLLISLINAKNTNEALDKFMDKYKTVLDKHAPLKKLTKKELKREKKAMDNTGLN